MKPTFTFEKGINPWEQQIHLENDSFSTISIIQRDLSDIEILWKPIFNVLCARSTQSVIWHTIGYKLSGSKAQEHIFLKKLKKELPSSNHLEKRLDSGIYSYVYSVKDTDEINISSLTEPRYSAMLFLTESKKDLREIWKTFELSDRGIDTEDLLNILELFKKSILCRFKESDTHAIVQLISNQHYCKGLVARLKLSDYRQIEVDMVAKVINDHDI